jgi:hypothetical protein
MNLRGVGWLGLIALGFAASSYYASSTFGVFGWANLVGGGAALAAAAIGWLGRASGLGTSAAARRALLPRAVWVAIAFAAAIALVRIAAAAGWHVDLTADERYTLAPATVQALHALPGRLVATLYVDKGDNRARSTRLLLHTLARNGDVEVRERKIDESAEDVERYGIASSNTVVLAVGDRDVVVERPSEGTLYEGLRRLLGERGAIVYVTRGEGEGDLQRTDEPGYSGLAAALQSEGFVVRDFVAASSATIPADADLLLVIGPQRAFRAESLAAIETWLEQGGRLVALLDPGFDTGLEALLGRFGFGLPDEVIVDPAAGPLEGDPPGVNPIAFQFAQHPATQGLDPTRMVFFRKARPVLAQHKPQEDDDLRAIAFSSRRAWLAPNAAAVQRGAVPERPAKVEENYWPMLSVGRYPRKQGDRTTEARIAVFGDSDFANNRSLRALYNLDLLMNTIHWAAHREEGITLRPKALTPDQYPLTPQQSLDMLYGVGLLVPELCLAAAAWTWVRRRSG